MRNRVILWAERALLAAGAFLLAGWAAVKLDARLYDLQQERRLERIINEPRPAPPRRPRTPRRVRPILASQDLVAASRSRGCA
jgi:hypothetical protein